jgi:molybdenum cofactor guanylyltransferase
LTRVLEDIQPIILVGGRSIRFGRDKLREPLGTSSDSAAEWMIDRPLRSLREIFGRRIAMVGECDDAIAARADLIIPDRYPGLGPAGGILSALEASGGGVMVLAGDLPRIEARCIRDILTEAIAHPEAWTILAFTDRPQPCIGVYRQAVRASLEERISQGRRRLHDLAPAERRRLVAIDHRCAANINTPDDLRAAK